jgi:hypothetical protein
MPAQKREQKQPLLAEVSFVVSPMAAYPKNNRHKTRKSLKKHPTKRKRPPGNRAASSL